MSRFSFFGPSPADQLLRRATSCKLELNRIFAEQPQSADGQVEAAAPADGVEVIFELRGDFPLNGPAADLLGALVTEFRRPASRANGGEA